MDIIREPLNVDIEADSRPLTKAWELRISTFIRAGKAKLAKRKPAG